MESQVIFHNRFVSPEEMVEVHRRRGHLHHSYRHEAQVVSGTLAYALGAGKAIISTPYWHADRVVRRPPGRAGPFPKS